MASSLAFKESRQGEWSDQGWGWRWEMCAWNQARSPMAPHERLQAGRESLAQQRDVQEERLTRTCRNGEWGIANSVLSSQPLKPLGSLSWFSGIKSSPTFFRLTTKRMFTRGRNSGLDTPLLGVFLEYLPHVITATPMMASRDSMP